MPAYLISLVLQCAAILILLLYAFSKKVKKVETEKISTESKEPELFAQEEKLIAQSQVYTKKAEESFEEELSQFRNAIQQNFEKELHSAIGDFNLYLKGLKNESEAFQKELEDKLAQQASDRIEAAFSDTKKALKDTQEKVHALVEEEVKAVKDTVLAYKEARFKAIDDQTISILEDTLKLFLAKRLTVADHVEEVFESLEQAKAEKFIT